ncbi:MAG: hypothetical protein KBS83_04285 [Lachnospiraceae bacterium]|nr:hypothetical protein [Candidatus Equihabitans merdae]
MKIFKKILAVGLGLTMMFSLAGCQEAAPSEAELPEPEAIEEEVNEIVGEAPDEDEIEAVEGWAPIVDVPVVESAADAVIGYIYHNSEEYFNNALTYV